MVGCRHFESVHMRPSSIIHLHRSLPKLTSSIQLHHSPPLFISTHLSATKYCSPPLAASANAAIIHHHPQSPARLPSSLSKGYSFWGVFYAGSPISEPNLSSASFMNDSTLDAFYKGCQAASHPPRQMTRLQILYAERGPLQGILY